MTRDWEVVGQFRMPEYLLNEKTNPLKEFTCRLSTMRTLAQEAKSKSHKIRDLASIKCAKSLNERKVNESPR